MRFGGSEKEREVAGADWRVFDSPLYSLVRVDRNDFLTNWLCSLTRNIDAY